MQNQIEFSPNAIKQIEVCTALNTLAYAISSDDINLIGKNVNTIISEKINELNIRKDMLEYERININIRNKEAKKKFAKKEAQLNDDITNLSAVMAFVNRNPNFGEIKLVATSGMFKRSDGTREFNSGVNTFAFYDVQNKIMMYAERGTASGEWGDNQYMVTNAITPQDYQAIQVREKFYKEFQDKNFEIENVIETGHSKGGHKAIICHLFNITQIINEINESSLAIRKKIKAINNLTKKYHCICEDAPWLSNETIEFFQKQLEPAYQNGLIPSPEIFIKQRLAKRIIRVNCENDYVSAINEQNKFGKEVIIKQTHNTVTGSHAIRTLWDVDENFNFNGKLSEIINEYGEVHFAAQKLFKNIDDLSLEKKHNTLAVFMAKADNMINKTNKNITGSEYYVASNPSEQKKFNKAKLEDGSIFLKIIKKTFLTKEVLSIIPKMFKKSKKVDTQKIFATNSPLKIIQNNKAKYEQKQLQNDKTKKIKRKMKKR